MSVAFAQGFATSAALIVAIGAQNAFVPRGVFARPVAWKVLDAGIALIMWGIAASLLSGG